MKNIQEELVSFCKFKCKYRNKKEEYISSEVEAHTECENCCEYIVAIDIDNEIPIQPCDFCQIENFVKYCKYEI